MRGLFLYLFFCILIPVHLLAQDDSDEELHSVLDFSNGELQKERDFLKFEDHFITAVAQKNIENYDKALVELSYCEKIYPNNSAMLFEKAKNLFVLNQYEEAIYYCEKALVQIPEDYWVLDLLKQVYVKLQNYQEAIVIQRKMYAINDIAAEDLLRLYYYTKNLDQGRKLLAEVDKKNINISNVDFYKRVFSKQTKSSQNSSKDSQTDTVENSIQALRQHFAKQKDYKNLQLVLEKELSLQNYNELLQETDMGLSLFPAQAKLYLYKAKALLGLEKHKEAIAVLESGLDWVVDANTLQKEFYKLLINAYQSIGDNKKVTQYQELVQKLQIP